MSQESSVRIMIKCAWSGARIQVPAQDISANTTLAQLMASVSTQLPPLFSRTISWDEPQPFILYMRTVALKRDWEVTTIGDVLGVNAAALTGSFLFTLNLPPAASEQSSALTVACDPLNSYPIDVDNSGVEPMDVDVESKVVQSVESEPIRTLRNILEHNFDSETKECLLTCLKIIDNILSNPHDVKVRCLKMSNATVQKKILSKKGGLEFLMSLGFEGQSSSTGVGFDFDRTSYSSSESNANLVIGRIQSPIQQQYPEIMVMDRHREDSAMLMSIRNEIAVILTRDLQVDQQSIPPEPKWLPSKQDSSNAINTSSNSQSPSSLNIPTSFDPFKSSSFNIQAAVVGAPNPHMVHPDGSSGISITEKKLDLLKQKQAKLEQTFQTLQDRNIVAYLPGETGPIVSLTSPGENVLDGKGDGALLASQMKKKLEDRKKSEDGGFTTKAMRDLEKMKKQKVYSHTQLKIVFPDGTRLEAKFLPNELISAVRSVIKSTFLPEYAATFDFELYISPPRQVLNDEKTLQQEGLVPAAKIHISWNNAIGYDSCPKVGTSPGSFIQRNFYMNALISSGGEFPQSISIEGGTDENLKAPKSNSTDAAAREEEIMQRMLGKRKGLGKSGSSISTSSADRKPIAKPKWFKG